MFFPNINPKEVNIIEMKKAIIVGSAMASFTVEKFGIERLMELDKKEIELRVSEFKKLVSFN